MIFFIFLHGACVFVQASISGGGGGLCRHANENIWGQTYRFVCDYKINYSLKIIFNHNAVTYTIFLLQCLRCALHKKKLLFYEVLRAERAEYFNKTPPMKIFEEKHIVLLPTPPSSLTNWKKIKRDAKLCFKSTPRHYKNNELAQNSILRRLYCNFDIFHIMPVSPK